MEPAASPHAQRAHGLVVDLQGQLSDALADLGGVALRPVTWLRDGGSHGGGTRYTLGDTATFNRASVNVSQVHYDDDPSKRLSSATALSTIVHPDHPRAPSMHMHLSWTEMRDGSGYWRMMADLNPAIEDPASTQAFEAALMDAVGSASLFASGQRQGDKYFHIPALDRHRGVSHFYLEGHRSDDWDADAALARSVGEAVIRVYPSLVRAGAAGSDPSPEDRAAQIAYHTLYLFQVLTLDRGTTSGLLVHDQNDVGILGSLPARVDRARLASWRDRVPPPQEHLVDQLVAAIGDDGHVTTEVKVQLAAAVRGHYRAHPEALALQASGDVVPPTVANHR